jgi:hypothetical protein
MICDLNDVGGRSFGYRLLDRVNRHSRRRAGGINQSAEILGNVLKPAPSTKPKPVRDYLSPFLFQDRFTIFRDYPLMTYNYLMSSLMITNASQRLIVETPFENPLTHRKIKRTK